MLHQGLHRVEPGGAAGPEAGATGGQAGGGKDEVLDAEFEEVKDKDGKAS